ncbi:trimethyllysine dioxygenase, mitochondrial isoform X3 [Onychostruthus taczanowskii]|uniref:trimethyllysine dioxygenase, mitochondrial isoform X3 n=1 Tax=Onychostruthus taczanowskii TaxID=356909 RepID=UPI001B80C852|nr:trimethyllysine dioxygenase, mitochondrial isoform X3 [Onychostruthus taczanowskii]
MVCGRSAPRVSMAAAAPPRGGLRRPRPCSGPGPAAACGLWGPAAPLRGTGAAPAHGEPPSSGRCGKASSGVFGPVGAGSRRRGKERRRGRSSSADPAEFPPAQPLRDPSRIPSLAPSSRSSARRARVPGCGARGWRGCSGGDTGAPDIAGRGCPGAPRPSWLSQHAAAPRPRRPPAVPGSCTETISVELRYGSTVMRLDFVWLRDHCRSASCYNAKTNQRSLDTASVDLAIQPQAVRVDETTLFLTWPDGHVTRYGLEWLARNSYEGQKQQVMHPRILWNAEIYRQAQVPSIDCRSFLETDEGLKEFLQSFLLYGIAFVENVIPTKEDTEILAKRISIIRETIYGRMWYFTSDFSRGDTAYTKLALDRHTDTTYFQEPCGIQVFHCLKHEGTGGRTLLVDGFHAAQQVLRQAPEHFELLAKVPLKHEYVENVGGCHNHMIGVGPVLNVYPWNNELYLIRYNNYDRAVINTVPHDVVRRWYHAHRALTAELRRPDNELWVKLKPGKVLFVDNWRVLHGREAFTGYRQLCGCYLTRDDVLNTARLLGLQA